MKKIRILTIAIVATVLTSTSAFASQSANTVIHQGFEPTQVQINKHKGHEGMFKTTLDKLVTTGTITQDQETAIINAFKNAMPNVPISK